MAGLYDDFPGKDIQDRRYYRETGIGKVLGNNPPRKKETVAYDTGATTNTAYGEKPIYKNIEVDVSPNPSDWKTRTLPEKLMRSGARPAAIPVNPMTPTGASDLNGVMSYLGNPNALKDLRDRSQMAQEVAPLISSGFRSLNNPAINAPISGQSPGFDENILVKERFGTPQEYNAAVQSNQNAARFGQQSGLETSLGARGYAPNDATKAGMQYGGAITEYAIPGKGQATFMGQRQGGGSFSVGGRSPEEQAAIKEAVAGIESQTAAMRGLRNANRQEQGLMTVEQEQQLNAMRQMMGGLAPPPDTRRLDEQQAALMQQLKDAQGIKGFGKRRQREAAMDAAKLGLAQLAGLRGEQNQQYGQQAGLAQSMMQNQAAQESAQAKALQDQAQFLADYGIKQEANQIAGQKNELDAAQAGARQTLDEQRLAIERARAQREGSPRPDPKYMAQFYLKNEIDPANPTMKFLPEQFTSITGIPPLPEKAPAPGQMYLDPKKAMGVIYGENGQKLELGLEDAILFDRAIRQREGR